MSRTFVTSEKRLGKGATNHSHLVDGLPPDTDERYRSASSKAKYADGITAPLVIDIQSVSDMWLSTHHDTRLRSVLPSLSFRVRFLLFAFVSIPFTSTRLIHICYT
ncbi:hypothetical protein BDN72DRAFT_180540 [Pluteus cervinus]|uniref:Uncharacterized protein n=1 Tax=Pluteus cervinus TaxID=181527 RepID=A0ACD3AKI3_9AGAR|nr:hypothetical protein BDN72DRAFT_180540 [Pluteus cervinus]